MYAVSHIRDAAGYIAAITEARKKDALKKPELTDEYIELFETVAHSHELSRPGWAYCFNAGELRLLAEYIFSDDTRESDEIKALFSPYRTRGEIEYIGIMYGLWQNHYDNAKYICLFDIINESDGFCAYFKRQYGIDTSELACFLRDGRAPEYFVKIAGNGGNEEYDSYCEKLRKLGVAEQSALYRQCANMYALVCDGRAYMKMGPDTVKEFMNRLCHDERVIMMQNMLRVLDSFQLKKFVSVFPLFSDYVGGMDSDSYRDIISPLPLEIKKKYLLWQNQYFIYSVLGEGDRADFWMGYADRGTFTKHGYAGILFLCFDGFTVIEFENVDAAYFFNSTYFEKKVEPYICNIRTENEIESWIYNNTEWGLDREHQDHWRKAHAGSWQLDMKSYMSRTLVRI